MKSATLIIFVSILFACSKKQVNFQMEGTLTGLDNALCPCCGDVVFVADTVAGNFRIDSLPFMSVQKLHTLSFPKRIQFNYSSKIVCGAIEHFVVTDYFLW